MSDRIHKILTSDHVLAMVKALETAGIPVKHGALGGYFVKARSKTTGERRTVFTAILVRPGMYLVTHDAELFQTAEVAP